MVTDAEQEKFGTHDETPITFQEFARAQCEDLWIEKNQALLRTSDDGLWVRQFNYGRTSRSSTFIQNVEKVFLLAADDYGLL